jgi:hypothetical protein
VLSRLLSRRSACGAWAGFDVMSIEVPGANPSVSAFFGDMRHCFTPSEWSLIRCRAGERAQLT